MPIKLRFHQKLITWAISMGQIVLGLVAYLGILAKYVSVFGSIVLTGLLVGLLFGAPRFLKKNPVDWVSGEQVLKIRTLPPYIRNWLVAALIAVWIPHFVEFFDPAPRVNVSFNLHSNYESGDLVDGIEWKSQYRKYRLRVENSASQSDVYDLRVCLSAPGGIVKGQIVEQSAAENVNYAVAGLLRTARWVTPDNKIKNNEKPVGFSPRGLVSASKVFPAGHFIAELIILVKGAGDGVNISYYYDNVWGQRIYKAVEYPISFEKDTKKTVVEMDKPRQKPLLSTRGGGAIIFDEGGATGRGVAPDDDMLKIEAYAEPDPSKKRIC